MIARGFTAQHVTFTVLFTVYVIISLAYTIVVKVQQASPTGDIVSDIVIFLTASDGIKMLCPPFWSRCAITQICHDAQTFNRVLG